MKKRHFAAAAAVVSLAISGCSAPASETTAAPTEAATTAAETAAETVSETAAAETTAEVQKVFRNGEGQGYGGPIKASVILVDGKIDKVILSGTGETPEVGGAALETLKEAIVAANGTEGVDAVAGATVTSQGVFDAVNAALAAAEE